MESQTTSSKSHKSDKKKIISKHHAFCDETRPKPQTAMCQRDCDLLLEVTDSLAIATPFSSSSTSPDGSYVLVLRTTIIGQVVLQPVDLDLYQNNNGKLILIDQRFPSDADLSLNPVGSPNDYVFSSLTVAIDWSIAAAIYENSAGNMIVNFFDPKKPKINIGAFLVNGTAFPGGFTSNMIINGGFSDDNQFLTFNFLASEPSGGIVQVYKLSGTSPNITGTLVASASVGGFANGSNFFDLCQKSKKCPSLCVRRRFIAVIWQQALVDSPTSCTGFVGQAPGVISIFEFVNNDSLILVDQISNLSSLPNNISIPRGICCPPEILIAISTAGTVSTNPQFYTFSDPARESQTNQAGGIIIYRFNGEKLNQLAYQPVLFGTVSTVQFYPNGKFLAVVFNTNVRGPFIADDPVASCHPRWVFTSFFQIFRVLNKKDDKCKRKVCLYPLDIPRPAAPFVLGVSFSLNGKWFTISGGAITNVPIPVGSPIDPTVGPVNELQFYRVLLPDCCPYPDKEDCIECILQNTGGSLKQACVEEC